MSDVGTELAAMVTDSVADLAKAIFHKFASEQRFLTYAKEYIDYAATHPDDFGACESAADEFAHWVLDDLAEFRPSLLKQAEFSDYIDHLLYLAEFGKNE